MKLNYRTFGSGDDCLLILHGLLGSGQNWHTVVRELAKHIRVVVPDLRNHGDSPHGEHSSELMLNDIQDLIQVLEDGELFLLGHSMGGLVAMQFAFTYPEYLKGLVVEDIGPTPRMSSMQWIFEALEELDLSKIRQRSEADKRLAVRIEDAQVRHFLLQNLRRQEDDSYGWRCNLAELHRFVREDGAIAFSWADNFEGPTLFIGGEKSDHRLAQQEGLIAQHFPNYQLKMIPGAGHWVHFDCAKEFVQTVLAFIRHHTQALESPET